jgi:hypothetical protein
LIRIFKHTIIFKLLLILIALVFIAGSCSDSSENEQFAARVYDKKLTKLEVQQSIPYGINKDDSTRLANDYIEQWIRRMLVLRKAEQNLDESQKDFSKQLEEYRISLIIFTYEQELLRQKIDTSVTKEDIENYYFQNQKNFELKKNIIRLRYVKLPENAPGKDKVPNWLNATDQASFQKLEQFCKQHAVNYLLNDQNWFIYDEILKEIPLQDYGIEQFNKGKTLIQFTIKGFTYFVKVYGFMMKDSRSPLNFEYNNIRNIILNQRRLQLIRQMQDDVYNEALNNNEIELYK